MQRLGIFIESCIEQLHTPDAAIFQTCITITHTDNSATFSSMCTVRFFARFTNYSMNNVHTGLDFPIWVRNDTRALDRDEVIIEILPEATWRLNDDLFEIGIEEETNDESSSTFLVGISGSLRSLSTGSNGGRSLSNSSNGGYVAGGRTQSVMNEIENKKKYFGHAALPPTSDGGYVEGN